jgi:hypothetical protein
MTGEQKQGSELARGGAAYDVAGSRPHHASSHLHAFALVARQHLTSKEATKPVNRGTA